MDYFLWKLVRGFFFVELISGIVRQRSVAIDCSHSSRKAIMVDLRPAAYEYQRGEAKAMLEWQLRGSCPCLSQQHIVSSVRDKWVHRRRGGRGIGGLVPPILPELVQ